MGPRSELPQHFARLQRVLAVLVRVWVLEDLERGRCGGVPDLRALSRGAGPAGRSIALSTGSVGGLLRASAARAFVASASGSRSSVDPPRAAALCETPERIAPQSPGGQETVRRQSERATVFSASSIRRV